MTCLLYLKYFQEFYHYKELPYDKVCEIYKKMGLESKCGAYNIYNNLTFVIVLNTFGINIV